MYHDHLNPTVNDEPCVVCGEPGPCVRFGMEDVCSACLQRGVDAIDSNSPPRFGFQVTDVDGRPVREPLELNVSRAALLHSATNGEFVKGEGTSKVVVRTDENGRFRCIEDAPHLTLRTAKAPSAEAKEAQAAVTFED